MRAGRPFAVALLLAAPGWAAAEWTSIASTDKLQIEIDPALVRKQGAFTMAYTRSTFTVPQPIEGRPELKQQSQLQLHAIDCAAGAATVVGVAIYPEPYARGEMIEQTTRPRAEWSPRPAPPGSLVEAIVRIACDETSRRPTQ
jgi:hypothetical protein